MIEDHVAEIAPFAAIRYDFARFGGDLSKVIAPPYDVLDQADKDVLLAKSDRNIVAVDLPHIPPKSLGPQEAYDRAAKTMQAWLADGTLIREARPAIYLYHQVFEHAGRSYTRRKFIARVRLRPFADGVILPHEQTFGGPKEDRLALMKATRCNLSPIFGLYRDAENRIGAAFAAIERGKPDATATLDGVHNKLWIVTDAEAISKATAILADKKVYIADGHHRYGTALTYQEFCRVGLAHQSEPAGVVHPVRGEEVGMAHDLRGEEVGTAHPTPPTRAPLPLPVTGEEVGMAHPTDHPANWVMFVLASMDDSGCLILPYYRTLGRIDAATVAKAWSAGTAPATEESADIVLYDGKTKSRTPLRFTHREVLATLAPEECPPWRQLDVAYLHRYLIDELLTKATGKAPKVHYVKSEADAKRSAEAEAGTALLLHATPMEHLRAVSDAGGLMPQKSTYFYPKLATGLTINPLA